MILCFWGGVKLLGFHGFLLFPSEVVLPKSLDVQTPERRWIDKGHLRGTWTRVYGVGEWAYLEALPLENGSTLQVKCNQDEGYIYSVDSQGQLFFNGAKVTNTEKWPSCFSWQVRAATFGDIGKPYVVSQLWGDTYPLPQRTPPKRIR